MGINLFCCYTTNKQINNKTTRICLRLNRDHIFLKTAGAWLAVFSHTQINHTNWAHWAEFVWTKPSRFDLLQTYDFVFTKQPFSHGFSKFCFHVCSKSLNVLSWRTNIHPCAYIYCSCVKLSIRITHHCGLEGLSSGTTQRAEVLIILQISNVSRTLSLRLIVPLGVLRSSLWEHFVIHCCYLAQAF